MMAIWQLYEHLIYPVVLTYHLPLIALIYALIRGKHDSYINEGKWKTWAFIHGVFFAGVITLLSADLLVEYIMFPIIFGVWFSIFFDMSCGLFRVGKLLYFGSGKYDTKMRQVFVTPLNFLGFKIIWLIILNGIYYSVLTQ